MKHESDDRTPDDMVINEPAEITLESILELKQRGMISARDAAKFALQLDMILVHSNNVAVWTRNKMGKNGVARS